MNEPSLKTVKKLFALSKNRCTFPNCISPIIDISGVVTGEISHIKAKRKNGPRYDPNQTDEERNAFENLILLCSPHHKIVDEKFDVYTVEVLTEMKFLDQSESVYEPKAEDEIFAKIILNDYRRIDIKNNKGTIFIDSPGAIKTESLTIRTQKKNIKLLPPENTIASDLKLRGYVKHLIDRYLYFAGSDKTRKYKFHHGPIYQSIKKEFGVKWDHIPKTSFNDLVEFLHKKIDRTRLAKINKSKGYPNYSSFEDFCKNKLKINT